MIRKDKIEYFLINETIASQDNTEKYHEILRENVQDIGGHKIYTLTFRQLLSECEVRNWNNRIYRTKDMWNAIVSNPLIQHDLTHGSKQIFGEYGHPQISKGMNELARQMTIEPTRVCWGIADPHMEGNLLFGTCTTTAGGWGDVLRDRALSGVVPMASTRAVGGCDANGNVLPNMTLITIDSVFRQSSKGAYADPDSYSLNAFGLPKGNSMQESAVPIDMMSDSFKDFLLTESISRDKINRVCDTMNLDYDSMVLTEGALTITKTEGNTRTKVVMPLSRLVGANHHHLFD